MLFDFAAESAEAMAQLLPVIACRPVVTLPDVQSLPVIACRPVVTLPDVSMPTSGGRPAGAGQIRAALRIAGLKDAMAQSLPVIA